MVQLRFSRRTREMENPRHAQLRKELPAEARGAAKLQEILRLRRCFAFAKQRLRSG
jgi:hypothetical protein